MFITMHTREAISWKTKGDCVITHQPNETRPKASRPWRPVKVYVICVKKTLDFVIDGRKLDRNYGRLVKIPLKNCPFLFMEWKRRFRLKMGMLRHCATEIICTTLCDPKKVCSNHCDSKWVCCDIVRPKLLARLCVAQKKFVATIATQNRYVATLCDRSYLHDFVWPKKVYCDRCDSKWVFCDIVRPKLFARLCVAQKKFLATIATENGYVAILCDRNYLHDFVRPKKSL